MKKYIGFLFCLMMIPSLVFAGETEIVTLDKCVDGDTANFKTSTGTVYKTRFLAVDTPETVHPTKEVEAYGKEASNYTCETLTNAKEIKLEYDDNSGREDKYGRTLAWVWVDGVLLQQSLIEKGLAEVAYLYDDYQYTSLLQDAEAVAKANKVGQWSGETPTSEEDSSKESEKETTKEEKKEKKDKEKNVIQEFFDNLLGKIFDLIDKFLENIVNWIESML